MEIPGSWLDQQRALIILSFLTSVLVLLPLPGFIKSRNIGCSVYAVWIALLCFTSFVNSIIWRDNARNPAPIWCDIYVRLSYCGSMGILSAGLVIARRVALIATSSSSYLTSGGKTKAMVIDLMIALVPPASQLIEYWFMAGHRFDILEGIGCMPAIPFSILNIMLSWVPNLLIALLSTVYCAMTLHALLRRHKHVKQVVAMSNMDLQLFYRLLTLACVQLGCTLPLVTYTMILNFMGDNVYYPWNGFADLHFGFDRIRQFPYELWSPTCSFCTQSEWYSIACGIVFFLLLGLTRDARSRYSRVLGLSKLSPINNQTKQGGRLRWDFWCYRRRRLENKASSGSTASRFCDGTIDSNQSLTFFNPAQAGEIV